ncbi:hypothetical protein [Serratia fonticola]|uniref:hypothetical protein n=1 Tax=Serratia fonticola TaxID=47917 RepID=UPI003AAEED49|nr:hypothetical protein [Serratia fonticola]
MLNDHEIETLVDLLVATSEVLGHEIRPAAAALMATDLAKYPLDALNKALAKCRMELTGRLTPKAIVERLQDGGVWLTANEAWAVALPATDESTTVVWTTEIAKAWAIALPLIQAGDRIGARMAFIPAYDRLVQASREAGKPAQWQISDGWDPNTRDVAIQKAQTAGLLPPPPPPLALPAPEGTTDRRADMADNMRRLAEAMRANRQRQETEDEQRKEEARQKFEARKAEIAAQALAMAEQEIQSDTPSDP